MNIGIIGAGEMGICLASKFAKLGHTVSMASSRGPASLKQLTKKRVDAMGTDWSGMRDVIIAKRKADEALMKADYPAYLMGLRN